MKVLVLYYSRTGTTAKVANALARAFKAQVAEIKCPRYRSGWFRYLLAGYDSVKGRLPPIEPPKISLEDYDMVLLGTPIWTSYPALPLRSFLAQYPKLPGRTGLFLTYGGHSPPEKAENLVSDLLPTPLAASLAIPHDQVAEDRYSDKVTAFVQQMSASED